MYKEHLTKIILEADSNTDKLPDWVIKSGNKPKEFEYEGGGMFVWKNGVWKDGVWENGIWKNGTWEDGTWEDGIWENGTWKNGIWKNGTWEDGIWENGTWKKGEWKDGVWENGIWFGGTWANGTWKKGHIWSERFRIYIPSKLNPKEFYKLEKESNNLNELKSKVG